LVQAQWPACLPPTEPSGIEVTMLDRWRTGFEALNHAGVQVIDPSGQESNAYPVTRIQTPPEWRKRNWRWYWSNPGKLGSIAGWLKTCLDG
jgi:hypothetical protein